MAATISCHAVFIYETASPVSAAQQGLAFAALTPIAATIDGTTLCLQRVCMEKDSNTGLSARSDAAVHQLGRRDPASIPAVTSVVSVRVRPPPSFVNTTSPASDAAFRTILEVYKVPLHDVVDTDLNLDPVHAEQAEKPFSVVLYTRHTEARSGRSVSAIELQSIPYADIAPFYGQLQRQIGKPERRGDTRQPNDGLVRSRSVSQQVGQRVERGASRYDFLYTHREAGRVAARAHDARSANNASSHSNDGASSSQRKGPDAEPKSAGRYACLAGGVVTKRSGSPAAATQPEKASRHDDDADSHSPGASAEVSRLPPGVALPTWFPSWDNFATAAPVDYASANTDSGSPRGGAEHPASTKKETRVGGAVTSEESGRLSRERELYMLKELRDRTNELEQARLAITALRAAVSAKETERDDHDAALIRRFPHLTESQRLLIDFDKLLLPLPSEGRPDTDLGAAPARHGEAPLAIRSAVLELAARSLGASSNMNNGASASRRGSAVRRRDPRLGDAHVPRAVDGQSCTDVSVLSSAAVSDRGTPRRQSRPTGFHTHAPLVAPRYEPTLRHRQHNEASTLPTAPAPVATSSVTSTAASASPPLTPTTTHLPFTLLTSSSNNESRKLDGAHGARTRSQSSQDTSALALPSGHRSLPARAHSAMFLPRDEADNSVRQRVAVGRHVSHPASSQGGSEGHIQSPPLPLAGTMPPVEPDFLLDDPATYSTAT